ncbi:MAG TPA: hypothetical protein DCR93_09425, partial [Cytophagales bacterium]|nr:hypothetical protein [Cytophagales bacterium]
MKNKTIYRLVLGLLCLLFLKVGMIQAQSLPSQFDGVDDVIYLGDSAAIISTFDTNLRQVRSTNGTSNGTDIYLGDLLDGSHEQRTFGDVYLFGDQFRIAGSYPKSASVDLHTGNYNTTKAVTGFTSTRNAYLSQIALTWNAVPGADGYFLFRKDQNTAQPYRVLLGTSRTMYTDIGLTVDTEYEYYICAYNLGEQNTYLGPLANHKGKTKPFTFTATPTSEVTVDFSFQFDNHLLVGLQQQAAYVEIVDQTGGSNQVVYEDELTLQDVAVDALLFDKAVSFTGNDTMGGYADPNLTAGLPTWSVEMWVNLDQGNSNLPYLYDDGTTRMLVDGLGRLVVFFGGVESGHTGLWSPNNVMPRGVWKHVAATYDGANFRVYVDGEPVVMGDFHGNNQKVANVRNGADLKQTLQIGHPTKKWAATHVNMNGALGLLRIWNKTRTANQIKEDYKDVFSMTASGLVGQWTFENETVNLPDNIGGGRVLNLRSNNNQHPIRWNPSYAFFNGLVNIRKWTWLNQPQASGTTRTFRINMYEVGTGKLISTNTNTTGAFTHPGAPSFSATPQSGTPYRVDLSLTPTSTRADAYLIIRTAGNQEKLITTLKPDEVPPAQPGDPRTYRFQTTPLTFTDTYAYGDTTTLQGGVNYSYRAIPVYNFLPSEYVDATAARSDAASTLDMMTSVTPQADRVLVDWDETALAGAQYDSVRVERNGQMLAILPSAVGSYQDSLMLYGLPYTYRVVALKNGQPALAQAEEKTVTANG